jgi:hypothetical protein
MKPLDLSQRYLQETIYNAYGNKDQFMLTFTCSHEKMYCKHIWRCIFGSAPTLSQINLAYGKNTSAACVVPLLTDVSEFCGCKEKLSEDQLEELSYIISGEYHWLKITEIMLFFWWFKSGKYGKFYGSVDPMIIVSALKQFVKDRNAIIAKRDIMEKEQKEKEWKKTALTYEQWRELHKNDNKSQNNE